LVEIHLRLGKGPEEVRLSLMPMLAAMQEGEAEENAVCKAWRE
jgi:hypothetical protein